MVMGHPQPKYARMNAQTDVLNETTHILFPYGRVPAGDLDTLANFSAKYRTSERRDIGYATPRGFCFIFTNDAKSLCSAIVPLHGDCSPEVSAFIGCWFYDLRA